MNPQARRQKVMRLLDPSTGLMQCRVCGAVHYARIKPDSRGNYYRGAWQCQHGCTRASPRLRSDP